MNSFKKFKENKLPDKCKFFSSPDKCKFFSSLKNCGINEKEYQRTINVWKVFKIKNLGEYHDLYLKTDVLLLCDVFEKFINTCLNYYNLDPSHYFSSPGLSFDAMLKMTDVKLELTSDISMHLFTEKGITGCISYISKRYSSKDDGTIMYWDANNLYGWAII